MTDSLEFENEENGTEVVTEESDHPNRLSPEWTDYVVSLLEHGEFVVDKKHGRCPNVAGLRRLSELLLGQIIDSRVVNMEHLKVPDGIGYVVAATYEVVFMTENGNSMRFGDAADVSHYNCNPPYLAHATACAATRAESRALRKALKLRGLAAEELDYGASDSLKLGEVETPMSEERVQEEKKKPSQSNRSSVMRFLKQHAKKMDINFIKFINAGESGITYDSEDEVPLTTLKQMKTAMMKFKNDASLIPDDIKGFEGEE